MDRWEREYLDSVIDVGFTVAVIILVIYFSVAILIDALVPRRPEPVRAAVGSDRAQMSPTR